MEAIGGRLNDPTERFNPFPGLRPFEPDEDHLFFGRERETDELLRRLRTNRFVSVLGTSGSGKSSLVRSGLIPSLYSGFMVQAGSDWRVAIFRPGEDPIGNLAAALGHEEVLGDDPQLGGAGRMLLESTLRRSALGLADCVRHARLGEHENLLVVVDQFEELFRFRESRKAPNARDEAVAFAKLLLGAAQQADVPVYVVITMRSDFIGDCMEYPGLPEAINRGQYLIPRMTREELRQAIVGPVAVGGGDIAPRLVTRLLNEVGDDPDQLPVLQHALMRTWEHWEQAESGDGPLDLTHYESVGTMEAALSRHAEEAFEELDDPGRRIAERLFKALTDKRLDDRGVRRPTAVREAAAIAGVDETEVVRVVETFRRPGRSFLMPPSSVELGGDSIIDLSHESLMRNWQRLVEWVEEETASGKSYRRLSRAARRFERGEGSLWIEPELSLGLKWRDETQPTAAWAARYDADFETATRFLDQSREAEARRVHEAEAARLSKLRRARILAGVLGSAAVITLGFGLYALRAGSIARAAERVATREAQTSQAVTEFMVGLFGVADPEEARGETITARELLDEGARRIGTELADQPAVQARMLSTVGKVYGSLGLYDDARPLLEQAVTTAEKTLGPDDPATLEARERLAETLWNQGHYDDAAGILDEVLATRRAAGAGGAPVTLRTMTALARVERDQGRYDEAERTVGEALAAQRELLGDRHQDTLQSVQLRGVILGKQGRYNEAEAALVEALAGQRELLGPEHSDTLSTMVELGDLYTDAGRFDEAQRLFVDSLERQRELFGDDHPKTLMALQRLALLNQERGLWSEAEQQMIAVVEGRREALGAEHPATLDTESRLAWVYKLQQRLDEAERLAQHAFQTMRRLRGEENVETLHMANVLASVYRQQGRYAEGEHLLTENLRIFSERYGPAHPQTLTARNNLAVSYGDWGRNDLQEKLFRENVELCRESYGEDHAQTLFFVNNLTSSLDRQRRYEEAEQVGLDALERHRRVFGEDNPQTLTAIAQLANVYRNKSGAEDAERLGLERLEGARRLFGEDHLETLSAMSWMAGLYTDTERHDEAIALRERILDAYRKLYGEDHPRTVGAYGALAWLHELQGRMDVALELRTQAIRALKRMADRDGAGPHDLERYAEALTNARPELQDAAEAVRYAERACRLTAYPNRNYLATLANAYFLAGSKAKAIETQKQALELIPEDDNSRDWFEQRLAQFEVAAGGLEAKRRIAAAALVRQKEAVEQADASPSARDRYAWSLLTVLPADLRDPQEALRVALAVNEDTGREDPNLLTTLALAYHQTGQRDQAVATQREALQKIPENLFLPRISNENRLLIYEGRTRDDADLGQLLPGVWTAQVGPVALRAEVVREGEYLVGINRADLPFMPKDEPWFRVRPADGEAEMRAYDAGGTNPRWEPGHLRVTDDGALLVWPQEQWFVIRLRKN